MRKIKRSIVSIICSLGLVFSFMDYTIVGAENGINDCENIIAEEELQVNSIDEYEYPITVSDSEWGKLECLEDKIAVCRIDEKILKQMTNEALVNSIIEYPFLYDLFLYQDYETAVEKFEDICDAYRELLNRNEAKDILLDVLNNRVSTLSEKITADDEVLNEVLSLLILYQNDFVETITYDEIKRVSDISKLVEFVNREDVIEYSTLSATDYSVTTPNGTVVSCVARTCEHLSANYHASIDYNLENTYGVDVVRIGNCRYNCHSYAWHDQNANPYWINNPFAYMTDGSYYRVMSGINSISASAVYGDKVFYGTTLNENNAHSAILYSSSSGVPLAGRVVRSKWGYAGVFEHTINNVPSGYDTSVVTVWRLN